MHCLIALPDGLIRELREGKFDTPKGEQYRIDILTNPDSKEVYATLAAESLGVFRTDDGLDALVSVLQKDIQEHVPTKMTIVASIMKYKEEGVPHIALMRQTLDSVSTDDAEDRKRKEALQERLVWFEEDYADEFGEPSD